jgi:hypothetical protein
MKFVIKIGPLLFEKLEVLGIFPEIKEPYS